MEKKIMRGAAIFLLCIAASCSKPEKGGGSDTPSPSPSPSPTPITERDTLYIPTGVGIHVPPDGATVSFTVVATNSWSTLFDNSSISWARITPNSGNKGSTGCKISVDVNPSLEDRSTVLKFVCGQFILDYPIIQDHSEGIILSRKSMNISYKADTASVTVLSNISYTCEIPSEFSSWITEVKTKSVNRNNHLFQFSTNVVGQNREGYILFKSKAFTDTVKILQKGWEMEAIDFGLSVKWAACNLGAINPWDFGTYFAWGDTKVKDEFYKDDYTTPKTFVDVATKMLGNGWRTPTEDEVKELMNNVSWEYCDWYKDMCSGYLLKGKGSGAEMFLPFAGGVENEFVLRGTNGNYWTSTPTIDEWAPSVIVGAKILRINDYGVYCTTVTSLWLGFSIRAVHE